MSDSVRPYELQPRLLRPWDSPGKNTGVDGHALLQGIFPTQAWNLSVLHLTHIGRWVLPLAPPGGFPGGSTGKESACNAGDLGAVPGMGRSPGEGKATHSTPRLSQSHVQCSSKNQGFNPSTDESPTHPTKPKKSASRVGIIRDSFHVTSWKSLNCRSRKQISGLF